MQIHGRPAEVKKTKKNPMKDLERMNEGKFNTEKGREKLNRLKVLKKLQMFALAKLLL